MSENHFVSIFLPFQINTTICIFVNIFYKMAVRRSLSVTFLAISDQYETLYFVFFTKWPPAPILDVRNSLLIAFLAISDQYVTLTLGYYCCAFWIFRNIGEIQTVHFLYTLYDSSIVFVWSYRINHSGFSHTSDHDESDSSSISLHSFKKLLKKYLQNLN